MLTSAIALAALMGAQVPDTVPLFADDTPLEITLVSDYRAIRADRADPGEEVPATVVLFSDGGADTLTAQLRARGSFRRDPSNCSFPPLRLNLKKGEVGGTVFAGQDKLKMVVSCQPGRDSYEQLVLSEYATYKAYRLVSEASFKVRLARITFVDQNEPDAAFTRYSFFIEDEDVLAERLGGEILEIPEGSDLRPTLLDARQATLVAIYQYLVGNPDWNDAGNHNVKLVQAYGTVRPVPYDFDVTGMVDPPYAEPDPLLGLETLTDRLYRGWCWQDQDTGTLLKRFRSLRQDMERVFTAVPGSDEGRRSHAQSYLAQFFEDIETDERAQRRLFRDCRDPRR